MMVDKGYREIAGIALAPDFFQLTSLALRQGLSSNLPPLFLGSSLSQQLGTSKDQIKGGDGWSFFTGNWLSEALFKMAGIQKVNVF